MENFAYLKTGGMVYDAGNETDLINLANSEGFEDFETVEKLQEGDKIFLFGDEYAEVAGFLGENQTLAIFKVSDGVSKDILEATFEENPEILERLKRIGFSFSSGE